jgi:DNA-binding XRE family transcriptional regulator
MGMQAEESETDLDDRNRALRCALAATIRRGRAERGLSQRGLAQHVGVSQSVIARLEAERSDPPLSTVVCVLAAVGARLVVPDAAEPTRMAGEYARDQAGRRLPAHLEPYRLNEPHRWWPGQTQILLWPNTPRWSYVRRLSQPAGEQVSERTARLPPAPRSEPC